MQGVRISFVRAISRGARTVPAMPAAETATRSDDSGDGELMMSRPPVEVPGPDMPDMNDSPGSGSAKSADKKERAKLVMVECRMESTKVQFVPFQMPHAPSAFQRLDRADSTEDGDFRSSWCGEGILGGGDRG